MKIFVTGATGAIGRRVIPLLVQSGHEVTAVARSAAKSSAVAAQGAVPVQVDLFDAGAITRAVDGHGVVINLATKIPLGARGFLPWAWRENNRIRTHVSRNLSLAARQVGVARFIQESFAPAYPDRGDEWIDESVPLAPLSYNRSIAHAEAAAEQFASHGGVGVVLRFGLFYGPGDLFIRTANDAIRKGWSPFLGRPSAFVTLVSQDDAAAAVVAALNLPSGSYNVADEPVRRGALADAIATAMGVRAPRRLPAWVAWLGGSVGRTIARSVRASSRKLREASGWRPSHADGIEGWVRSI